jgi:hypothetical protein
VRGHGKPAGHSAVGAEAGTRGSCLGQRRVAASDWGVWRLPARVRMWGARSGPVQGHVVPSYRPTNFSLLVRLGWLLVRSGFPFLTVFQGRFRHLGCGFLLVLDAHRGGAGHCSIPSSAVQGTVHARTTPGEVGLAPGMRGRSSTSPCFLPYK